MPVDFAMFPPHCAMGLVNLLQVSCAKPHRLLVEILTECMSPVLEVFLCRAVGRYNLAEDKGPRLMADTIWRER